MGLHNVSGAVVLGLSKYDLQIKMQVEKLGGQS
jgi:hypothetical protein